MEIHRLFTLVSALPVIIFGSRAWPQETDASPTPGREQNAYLYEEDHAYLLRHNPFYFAYGNPISKVQLSFRMKPIADIPLYFAYTQLMFWELQRDSSAGLRIKLIPSFYLQYYTGYAESILTYNQYAHTFRAGLIF